MIIEAHDEHGVSGVTYSVHPSILSFADSIALASAWTVIAYLYGRSFNRASSSITPRGKPLYPTLAIVLFGRTMTAPTLVDGSLLHCAMCFASSRNRSSHMAGRIISPAVVNFISFISITPFCYCSNGCDNGSILAYRMIHLHTLADSMVRGPQTFLCKKYVK